MNKELKVLVEKLCEDLTSALHTQRFEHTHRCDYSQLFRRSKIHSYFLGREMVLMRSAWGFINKKEFQKGATGITFKEGDVLKCAGWKTPALNAPRGNLFNGYDINPNSMRLYGPDYLR